MKRKGETPLLPEGALPCLWMTAGLVAFKLCDRFFDCENCPLDAALGMHPDSAGGIPADRPRVAALEFRADRSYHPAHGWAREVGPRRVRVGMDALVGRLLDRVTAVVLPPVQGRIRRDRPACWLWDEGESFPLHAPVSGTVARTNEKVQEEPDLLATSPYDEGWLLEVACEDDLAEVPGLLAPGAMRQRTGRQLRWLRAQASRRLAAAPATGPTMADGGQRLTGLRMILGTRGYHRLVRHVLSAA